ncbi:ABC transporter ATP-binding protein [Aquabacter spiritensis]|uniref:Amino acid/amide ABC transporter ATP-binding protein 2 (HAAT family) n=1 Tax=Aquabacter spiritensis TaxID=933073 RepID=A0A4R3LUL6_9HYPH|nr:ABC transporter ATP-binding protein [Aquabacter spiritensis]TCT04243.1 amino acid/amide ABC transporter ATP-binding protein 2 (HAAT family) [Aquabacter spiritensis]
MLALDRLCSAYGRIVALHDVSLAVKTGEIVALVGSNGAGKTTLLRTVSGVQPAASGRILFEGAPIERLEAHVRVARGIAQSPEGRQVFGPLSVADNLALGAYRRRSPHGDTLARVFDLFPVLKEKRHIPAMSLSGGQQQMLAIGRALMAAPKLLLLDEPSLGLAPLLVDQILAAVVRLKAEGMTVLLVEQNASAALAIADRGYVLETGRVVLEGAGAALLADPKVREAYLGL